MASTLSPTVTVTTSVQGYSLASLIHRWSLRRSYRAQLRQMLLMGPELIADFGMTLDEAEQEAHLPFWKSAQCSALRPL